MLSCVCVGVRSCVCVCVRGAAAASVNLSPTPHAPTRPPQRHSSFKIIHVVSSDCLIVLFKVMYSVILVSFSSTLCIHLRLRYFLSVFASVFAFISVCVIVCVNVIGCLRLTPSCAFELTLEFIVFVRMLSCYFFFLSFCFCLFMPTCLVYIYLFHCKLTVACLSLCICMYEFVT